MIGWKKLAESLRPNDTVVAQGGVYLKEPKLFSMPKPTILVRSGEQDYRLLVKGENAAIAIRGLIQSPYVIPGKSVDVECVQFPTDSGVVYYLADMLYPGSPDQKRLMTLNHFEKFMEVMKGISGLQQVELCPFCGNIRPADIPECSNPECAPKAETEAFAELIQIIITGIGVAIGLVLLVAPGLRSALVEMSPFLAREAQGKYGIFSLPILAGLSFYLFAFFVSILYRVIRRISTG